MNADVAKGTMYRNLIDYSHVLSALLGYGVKVVDGKLLISGPMNVPTLNVAMCEGGSGDLQELVSMAEEHFSASGAQYTIWTFGDEGSVDMMGRMGYSKLVGLPGMMKRGEAAERSVEGLEMVLVKDQEALMDFASVAFEAFEFPKEDGSIFFDSFRRAPLTVMDKANLLVGYLDGEPVATAISYTNDESTGVYFVGTLERARGKGIGAAMTARCVNLGVGKGVDVSVLQSSQEGYGIYARAGFETFCTIELYAKGMERSED
ncbi:MAG: GNAT family N-acetyltransferase [Methanomassiliicoccales archaeon]|jgi:ribosomal protein S18 acetylase RimI-like enzyme